MNAAHTLFVFATRAEADPLLATFGDIVCSQSNESHLFRCGSAARLLLTGMGPDAAGRVLREELARVRPAAVVNAGIAGALHAGFGLGDLVDVEATAHAAPGAAANFDFLALVGQRPAWWPRDLRRGRLLTRTQPLFDANEAAQLAASADLVDMEGAAIAQACADAGIPCAVIKAVSDFADDRATLLSNLAGASHALAQVLRTAFGSPAFQE